LVVDGNEKLRVKVVNVGMGIKPGSGKGMGTRMTAWEWE